MSSAKVVHIDKMLGVFNNEVATFYCKVSHTAESINEMIDVVKSFRKLLLLSNTTGYTKSESIRINKSIKDIYMSSSEMFKSVELKKDQLVYSSDIETLTKLLVKNIKNIECSLNELLLCVNENEV